MRNLFLLGLLGLAAAGAQDLLWETRPGFTGFGPIAVGGGVLVTGNITAKKGTVGIDAQTGKVLWRLPGKMYNGPANDGRYAYTVHFVTDVEHRLSALDLKSGKTVWSVAGPGFGSKADLLADGGRVYLVGEDGKTRAFDAGTGKLLWTFAYSPGKGFCPTSPVADGNVIYFGGGEESHANSQGVYLWAVDAATGKEAWRFAVKPESYSRIGECVEQAAVGEGMLAVTGSGILYGLDARTGAVRWKSEVRRSVEGRERRRALSAPHILAGRVYAIFEEGLAGWNLRDGSTALDFAGNFPPEQNRRRLGSAGRLLFFTANFEQPASGGNRQGFLYAFDPAERRVKWKHRVNRASEYSDPANWGTSEFAFDDNAVYYENYQFVAKVRR